MHKPIQIARAEWRDADRDRSKPASGLTIGKEFFHAARQERANQWGQGDLEPGDGHKEPLVVLNQANQASITCRGSSDHHSACLLARD
jgi:hypothetical protein